MLRRLNRDQQGAAIIEFALAAPAILMFIVGVGQLGMLCMANASLSSAVAEGARAAAVFPTPDDETILARIDAAEWGMMDGRIVDAEIERTEDENSCEYIDITMGYSVPLDFIFFDVGPVTLTESRRVWAQSQEDCGSVGGSSSTSTSTSSTSTGSTTSASGGDASTSSTSTGGSTSASSTSTSSTSTSSTSTSSGSSNGNGSSGHSHGNGSSSNGNGSSGNGNGN